MTVSQIQRKSNKKNIYYQELNFHSFSHTSCDYGPKNNGKNNRFPHTVILPKRVQVLLVSERVRFVSNGLIEQADVREEADFSSRGKPHMNIVYVDQKDERSQDSTLRGTQKRRDRGLKERERQERLGALLLFVYIIYNIRMQQAIILLIYLPSYTGIKFTVKM